MTLYRAPTIAAVAPVPTADHIITRLDAGEPYDEGSALEADILAHCRVHGRDIVWEEPNGNVTCFGDVEGRAQ